jgi:heme exporter protein C
MSALSTRRLDWWLARLTPVLAVLSAALVLAALYAAWLVAPEEAIQGPAQRIFYTHVPLAWTAYLAFGVVFVASIGYLWTRRPGWDLLARCSAEVGVVITTAVLITGSLWGKPIWGTWWTWDARLTSTLVLWLIYVGYLMLRSMVVDQERAARYAAVVGIAGAFDIPFIHFAVLWWRTLHPQPVVLREGGPTLPSTMLATLLIGVAAFTVVYVTLLITRIRVERARERLDDLQQQFELLPS